MARIKGNSETREFVPQVRLITSTKYPIGTLVSLWIGSRFTYNLNPCFIQLLLDTYRDEELEKILCECYPEYAEHDGIKGDYKNVIINVAKMVIKSNLPPLDALNFTFVIDDASVAFREQLVRSRQPQNFWMQTSRTADLTSIDVNMLPSISAKGPEAERIYRDAVDTIRTAYEELTELGVPSEDIRLIPQGMTHRIYWMVPYRTLKMVLSTRLSWIAQSALWGPIIQGCMKEIREDCSLLANELGVPSDIRLSNGVISFHKYDNENEDRYYGRDYQPCDPLWLAHRGLSMPKHTDIEFYDRLKAQYINLWNDEVLGILGWDREDPSKLGKYDRPVE